jgi:hypothetical protein
MQLIRPISSDKSFPYLREGFHCAEKLSLVYKRDVSETDTANSSGGLGLLKLCAIHGFTSDTRA